MDAKIFMLLKLIFLTFQPSVICAEGVLTVILIIAIVIKFRNKVKINKTPTNWLNLWFHLSKTHVELPLRAAVNFEQVSEKNPSPK